jgi:DNA-binding CsgD family transcriptional regulator
MQALWAAASVGQAVPDGMARAAADALAAARHRLTPDWDRSLFGAQLAMAESYAARLAGRPAVHAWAHAVDIATPFGAFFLLRPQLELSLEQLRHGERDAGKESLIAIWRAAESMGARWFVRQSSAEARRHRVPLPIAGEDHAGPLDRLTPRERDVLRLLERGATNRAISSTLFISEKTTALHVSNILSKLGVANRGEAAALARRMNDSKTD